MNRCEFDASFKRMAIDLSYARGSIKEVAEELGIDPGRLSKWRQKDSLPVRSAEGLTDEQREIKRLQKELKEAVLDLADRKVVGWPPGRRPGWPCLNTSKAFTTGRGGIQHLDT